MIDWKKKNASEIRGMNYSGRNKIFNFDRVEINFTFSAGVSTSSEVFSNHQMASREKVGVLINMADQRMYHAKGMGKNRVVFEI